MSTHCCASSTFQLNGASRITEETISKGLSWVWFILFLFLVHIISRANYYMLQSQLKKNFFSALQIHKKKEAKNPSLMQKCPATSVVVWDAIRNCMDEALERVRR